MLPVGGARLCLEKACRCCHSYSCHMVSSLIDLLFSTVVEVEVGPEVETGRRARSYTEPATLHTLPGRITPLRGSVR